MKRRLRSRRNAPSPGLALDPLQLVRAVRERWWLPPLCVALALLLAGAYIVRSPRLYLAHAVVQVQSTENRLLRVGDGNPAEELDKLDLLKTIEFNLGRRDLLARLVDSLHIRPEELGLPPGRAWSRDDVVYRFSRLVAVNLLRGTRLIAIDVQHPDPRRAAELANGLLAEYGHLVVEERDSTARRANEALAQEAARLKAKLGVSEQALQQFREQTRSVSLEESQNIIVVQLKELTARLADARADRLKLDSAADRLRGEGGAAEIGPLLAIQAIASAPQVVELQKNVAALEAEVAKLNERYLELHPKLVQAKSELRQARESLRLAAVDASRSLLSLAQAARATEEKYQAALAEQEQKALELNRLSITYNSLARDVASDSVMFESTLRRLKESDSNRGVDPGIIQIVEAAGVPQYPVKPRPRLAVLGAVAGGTLAGVVLALVLWALDRTFRTVDQVEGQLETRVLATVPRLRRRAGRKGGLAEDLCDPFLMESFRTLRTALALQDPPARVVLMTSAIPGEGKSFTAAHYAMALAAGGSSVLLIDADLRRPVLEGLFFEPRPAEEPAAPGLREILAGTAELEHGARPTRFTNLTLLPAGAVTADAGRLLLHPRFAGLLREAREKYEHVVIDSAPIHAVSDTLAMVRHPLSVCFVVMTGKAPRHAVTRALGALLEAGAGVIGAVLNGVPERGEYFYHYHTTRPEAARAEREPVSA